MHFLFATWEEFSRPEFQKVPFRRSTHGGTIWCMSKYQSWCKSKHQGWFVNKLTPFKLFGYSAALFLVSTHVNSPAVLFRLLTRFGTSQLLHCPTYSFWWRHIAWDSQMTWCSATRILTSGGEVINRYLGLRITIVGLSVHMLRFLMSRASKS